MVKVYSATSLVIILLVFLRAQSIRKRVERGERYGIRIWRGDLKRASAFLQQRARPKDALAFITCGKQRHSFGESLRRAVPQIATQWSHFSDQFFSALSTNRAFDVRKVYVVLGTHRWKKLCLRKILRNYFLSYFTEWIVFNDYELLLEHEDVLGTKLLLCGGQQFKYEELESSTGILKVSVFSRLCSLRDGEMRTQFTLPPEGKQITFACHVLRTSLGGFTSSCQISNYIMIHEALRFQNATVKFERYYNRRTILRAIYNGDADAMLVPIIADSKCFYHLHISPPLHFSAETFFTSGKSYSPEISFSTVLTHSFWLFLLITLTLLACWLVLASADLYEFGHIQSWGDSGTFLIASFLSTSVPMNSARRSVEWRRTWSCRRMFLLVWLMGVLPLSTFLRGELISRLCVTVEPNFIDTLHELETALDNHELLPCVWGEQFRGRGETDAVSHHSAYIKLNAAIKRMQAKMPLVFDSAEDCFRCARRPGFACYISGMRDYERSCYIWELVESQERINLAYEVVGASKDYAYVNIFNNLLRRLLETGLHPPKKRRKDCVSNDAFSAPPDGGSTPFPLTQMQELSAFFSCFGGLLLLAFLVFFMESVLGKRRTL